MMTQPWLSVIIPTYNGAEYLPFALDSIIEQSDNAIECIAVDDCSTDATLSILNAYKSRHPLQIIKREKQGNWVANTNFALSLAKGQYVCFLHQDDLWFKDRLRVMRQVINQFPGVDFFLHASNFINVDGDNLGLWQCPLPSFPEVIKSEIMLERLLIQNFISIPAPIFRLNTALRVGGLDETAWYTADWDFWLKIAACSDTLYYPKPLSAFRIHPNSQTIVRSSYLIDFRGQLERVATKHLALWEAPEYKKKEVRKIADFSIQMNSALAGALHGTKPSLVKLLTAFLSLGPSGWHRYFRDSRILERMSARLKAGPTNLSKTQSNR
jgi:glycosyltransferase involved in cell wall biosynthesis